MALLPEVLSSERLRLSRFATDAADELFLAVRDSFVELHNWMPWAAQLPDLAALRGVLEAADAAFESDTEWQYLLYEKEGPLVGAAGLHRRAGPGCLEIGYWVRSDRTGRGYASEAARALTKAAFSLSFVEQVEIHMDKANEKSAAVAQNLGYRLVGQVERDILTPGHSGKVLIYRLGRDEHGTAHSATTRT